MKLLNSSIFDRTKIPVFILTYLGVEYFLDWSSKLQNASQLQFVLVDNGQQHIPQTLPYPVYQTEQNIGCAGGWNLISQLAFRHYSLDKVIIGQDDAMFTADMISNIWESVSDDVLVGAYDRAFDFSLFGITKSLWESVGMFDENFIYVGCEDNDYKQRIRLAGKRVVSLNYSADMNSSMSSRFITSVARPANEYNVQYITEKWGTDYQYSLPFDGKNDRLIHSGLIDVYGEITEFPSITEYTNYEHSISQ